MPRFVLSLALFLSLSILVGAQDFKELSGNGKREIRGIWVASVYNLDWPSKLDQTEEEGTAEIISLLDQITELGFNTIYLQVKPAWGVFYQSDLEPVSRFLVSEGSELTWDPLAVWLKEGRKRGLFLHAWINPFRVLDNKNAYPEAIWHKNVPRANMSWLDPSSTEVSDHILALLKEMIGRYDFDGIHLDDYFYPYPDYLEGEEFDDKNEFEAYQKSGGVLDLSNWRRENINRFIEQISLWIRGTYPSKVFGISPFGIWKESQAYNIKGTESYETLYADSLKWINEGWIDYLAPQLYWSLERPKQNFSQLLDWWSAHVKSGRQILAGIQTQPVGSLSQPAEKEIERLYTILQEKGKTQGLILFRLKTLLESPDAKAIFKRVFRESALPAPLFSKPRPPKPLVFIRDKSFHLLNARRSDRLLLRYKKGSQTKAFISDYTLSFQLPESPVWGESLEILYINESGNLSPAFTFNF